MRARSFLRDISSPFRLIICLTCVLACGPSSSRLSSGTTRSSIESERSYEDPPLKDSELSESPQKPSASVSPSKNIEKRSETAPRTIQGQGYRIQIHSFRSQKTAETARKQIQQKPGRLSQVNVYIEKEPPYYKIRVGDFQTREEAEKLLTVLHKQKNFQDAWIVATTVNLD